MKCGYDSDAARPKFLGIFEVLASASSAVIITLRAHVDASKDNVDLERQRKAHN